MYFMEGMIEVKCIEEECINGRNDWGVLDRRGMYLMEGMIEVEWIEDNVFNGRNDWGGMKGEEWF